MGPFETFLVEAAGHCVEATGSLLDRYDASLLALETEVADGSCSVESAMQRAFILGMNYQTAANAESAANKAWGEKQERLGRRFDETTD